jgi:hypothetical protein
MICLGTDGVGRKAFRYTCLVYQELEEDLPDSFQVAPRQTRLKALASRFGASDDGTAN